MLKDWIKDKLETYLLFKYIMVIETLKYLKGNEYVKKISIITQICYNDDKQKVE